MIESLFEFEANKSSGDRALNIIQARLGDNVADMVRADRVPTMEDVEISEEGLSREAFDERFAAFTAEEEDLLDLAEDLRGQVASEILKQIKAAKTEEEPLTLTRVLDEYAGFKSVDGVLQGDLGMREQCRRSPIHQHPWLPLLSDQGWYRHRLRHEVNRLSIAERIRSLQQADALECPCLNQAGRTAREP